MFEKLKPDLYYQNIFAIDFGELARKGVRGLIVILIIQLYPGLKTKSLKRLQTGLLK